MKTFAVVIVILLLLGGGAYYWFRIGNATAAVDTAPQTAKVERKAMKIVVASTGRVVSNLDVDIKCKASGPVINLTKNVSDTVTEGELLCEVDPVDTLPQVRQAQASLDSSKARYAQSQSNYEIAKENIVTSKMKAEANVIAAQAQLTDAQAKAGRTKELTEKKLASQEELETANTSAAQAAASLELAKAQQAEIRQAEMALDVKRRDIEVAKAQVDKDQSNLDDTNQRLKDTNIYAPMDGVIVARMVNKGSLIQSGTGSVSGGTTIMTLSDLSHIWVYATVDESDIGSVAPQQQVEISADAYQGVEFTGFVDRIATKGINKSEVVTFEVRIEVTSRNKRLLRPEMTANVKIITMDEPSVIQAPVQAVIRQREQRRRSSSPATSGQASAESVASATPAEVSTPTEPTSHPTTRPSTRGAADSSDRSIEAILRRPVPGTATVVKADGAQEQRQVTVGHTDGNVYEILSGLEEGETVVLQTVGEESRWRGGGGRPMGMMGGGGGGGGRGR